VKFGGSDYVIIQGTDGSAPLVGVSDQVGIETGGSTASGARIDVIRDQIANVVYGGNVTRGKWLTADANGKAVEAVLTPGTEIHVIGRAEVSGVAGDVAPVYIQPIVIATDTGIATADVTITTEELLALNATPIELIAAPGAGKAILVEDVQLFLDFNAAAYAGIAAGEDLALKYTDGNGAQILAVETTGFLDAVADEYRHARPATTAAIEAVANAAVVAHMLVGEITTGDSPLKCRIRYRTVDVAW
jgi:hypothetical protein